MPELPEVETICRQLSKLIVGKKIKKVSVNLAKIVKTPLAGFRHAILGARVEGVWRRAKLIFVELDNDWTMIFHLKMTGQLIYQKTINNKQSTINDNHTHVIFNFTDGSRLFFNDLRQFGYIKLVKTAELGEFFIKEGTGPEPLERDFTLSDFEALLSKKPKARIKQFLMDPKNIAGIGNIYSDEILFSARVNPLRRVGDLQYNEVRKIYDAIREILPRAIKLRGTSAENYLDAFGQKGEFLNELKVYGREREKCVGCGGKVERIKIGGRSAHFCPSCQI